GGVGLRGARVTDGQHGYVQRDERLFGVATHINSFRLLAYEPGVISQAFLPESSMVNNLLLSCSILILAGGRGSRMGGQDKGLVMWHGKSLINWLHSVARPLTNDLIISCNRNQHRYAGLSDQIVSDDEKDF